MQNRRIKQKIENVEFDGQFLMNNLFSSGYPTYWNESNVVTIGIMDDGKINETKLAMFYDLAASNYTLTKTLFRTDEDYYFFFSRRSNY